MIQGSDVMIVGPFWVSSKKLKCFLF